MNAELDAEDGEPEPDHLCSRGRGEESAGEEWSSVRRGAGPGGAAASALLSCLTKRPKNSSAQNSQTPMSSLCFVCVLM